MHGTNKFIIDEGLRIIGLLVTVVTGIAAAAASRACTQFIH